MARFGIGISTAIAWTASAQQGQMAPAKQGRCGGSRLGAHKDYIVGIIEEAKDVSLNEMALRRSKSGRSPFGAADLMSGCEALAGDSKKTANLFIIDDVDHFSILPFDPADIWRK